MTTIVADQKRGYMAADHMAVSNDGEIVMPCETKINQIEIGGDRYLVGLSGLEGPGEIFLDWFENGDWDDPLEPISNLEDNDDFSVVVLGPEGIEVVDKFMRLTHIDSRYYGIGSGGVLAWAVLIAGCDIKTAMNTAIEMDPNTGFGYEVVEL